jgi:hypothetical protein
MLDLTTSQGDECSPSRKTYRRAALAAAILLSLTQPAALLASSSFEIDEDAAERALERALVQTGSLLLPARTVEVVPYFTFQRQETDFPAAVGQVNGTIVATDIALERNDWTAGLIVRAGLPWAGQIGVTVPYVYADRTQDTRLLGSTISSESMDLDGIGDVRATYSQSLLAESGRMPSLIASVYYDSDTGDRDTPMILGSGYNELGVSLTATTRDDPLVFSYRIGYEYAWERDGIKPGDEISLAAGAFLAVSPDTSLQLGFSLVHSDEVQLNGNDVSGSDQLAASLNLGIATILQRNVLFDLTLSVGLTNDSPEFGLGFNLPLRFTL